MLRSHPSPAMVPRRDTANDTRQPHSQEARGLGLASAGVTVPSSRHRGLSCEHHAHFTEGGTRSKRAKSRPKGPSLLGARPGRAPALSLWSACLSLLGHRLSHVALGRGSWVAVRFEVTPVPLHGGLARRPQVVLWVDHSGHPDDRTAPGKLSAKTAFKPPDGTSFLRNDMQPAQVSSGWQVGQPASPREQAFPHAGRLGAFASHGYSRPPSPTDHRKGTPRVAATSAQLGPNQVASGSEGVSPGGDHTRGFVTLRP